jgi:flagellar biosynthesis protein FliQ
VIQAVLDVSEFSVKFDVPRFIRVFIYHVLFFYLGPFMLPLISLFDSNGLVRNMGFWFRKSLLFSFVLQYM